MHVHLVSLHRISRDSRVGNPFSHGRLLSPQMSKGHFLWYFLSCPGRKKVRKKNGVDLRDVRTSLKILHSRRGRRIVHQITGSKVVTLAYFTPYRISNPVGACLCARPKTYAFRQTQWIQTLRREQQATPLRNIYLTYTF